MERLWQDVQERCYNDPRKLLPRWARLAGVVMTMVMMKIVEWDRGPLCGWQSADALESVESVQGTRRP